MIETYEELLYENEQEMRRLDLSDYTISQGSAVNDRRPNEAELHEIFRYKSPYCVINSRKPYKRRIFIHRNSYYLPDFIRGMTDTVKHIWINAKEYFKDLVLRHEKIHVAHPEWPEDVVRQFHDSYEPYLPDVEFVDV